MFLNKFFKYFCYFTLVIIFFVISFITYVLFQPAVYLPKPTGQYSVGSKLYHLIDNQRKDINGIDQLRPYQELMIKIWYPIDYCEQITYIAHAKDLYDHLKKTRPFISLFGGVFRQIYCFERSDAKLASDKSNYPVIIFSPGDGGRYDSNTIHCQELASHGYIVVGISHPIDSTIIQFPD